MSIAAGLLALVLAAGGPPLRVEGQHFRDPQGRVVLLRGINVAGNAKVPPFMPIDRAELLAPLPGWGFNMVRLLFNWEAYEPLPGIYNPLYLAYVSRVATWAGRHGQYVVIDFHQDAFSRFSVGGCGDGLPAWAVPPTVPLAAPQNGPTCASWGVQMLLDAGMHQSWHHFHADTHGARSRYLLLLAQVARHFASHPAVIGYDMLNEPWGDEPTEINPLFEDAARAIRAAHPTAILFVSSHALTSAGLPTRLVRPSFANFAISPHYYDGMVMAMKVWTGNDGAAAFNTMASKAREWQVPLFVGEIGAPADTVNGAGYVAALYDRLDQHLASGAHWVYTPGWTAAAKDGWNHEDLSIVDDTGRLRSNFKPRPYPQRTAGVPTHLWVTDGVVDVGWQHVPGIGDTEIFVPGQVSRIEADAGVTCATQANKVLCQGSVAGPVRVRISR